MNPFEFYGLTASLLIDEAALRRQFLEIQRQWHPDFFAGQPEKELEASEKTSLNNTCYQKLCTLPGRMQSLLEINGMAGESSNVLPASFLMEMMEVNDELEMAGNNAKKLQNIKMNLTAAQDFILSEIQKTAEEQGAQSADERFLSKIQVFYQKLRYLKRLLHNTEEQMQKA